MEGPKMKTFRSGEKAKHKSGRTVVIVRPIGNGKAVVTWEDTGKTSAARFDDLEPIGNHR